MIEDMDKRQEMAFDNQAYPGWVWPHTGAGVEPVSGGARLTSNSDEAVSLGADDVHTWNGDAIELVFRPESEFQGKLEFGYFGGSERALAVVDFSSSVLSLSTSDWRLRQPVTSVKVDVSPGQDHTLRLRKSDGRGDLIKLSDIEIYWDGEKKILGVDQDVLPEMGVRLAVRNQSVLLRKFVHYGNPPPIPEYLHVGGFQILNQASIEKNLEAVFRGLRQAAELGIQLLVTPETSLTGLFAGNYSGGTAMMPPANGV